MNTTATNTQTASSQPCNERALDRCKRHALELFSEPYKPRVLSPKRQWRKAWRNARVSLGIGKRNWSDDLEIKAIGLFLGRCQSESTTQERLDDRRHSKFMDDLETEHYRRLEEQDALKDDDGCW